MSVRCIPEIKTLPDIAKKLKLDLPKVDMQKKNASRFLSFTWLAAIMIIFILFCIVTPVMSGPTDSDTSESKDGHELSWFRVTPAEGMSEDEGVEENEKDNPGEIPPPVKDVETGYGTGEASPAPILPLVPSIRFEKKLDFCGETVPLASQAIKERLERELLISLGQRHQAVLWMKRSTRFLPIVEQKIKDRNMPDDLKYMPFIESAMLHNSGSPKGAMGYWQFMAATGRKYGLVIDSYLDERRNIYKSTDAALSYLQDLYDMFGSWTLAAAAYNVGERRVQKEIAHQKTDDYYNLNLYEETQRYVFRILSAKLILSDPEKYGFHFSGSDYYPPLESDMVEVSCKYLFPVHLISDAAGIYFKQVKDLNPEIRGRNLKRGTYSIMVPVGSYQKFYAGFPKLMDKWVEENRQRMYTVKRGDNLTSIANRFNVSLSEIRSWNNINIKKPIHPGDQIVVYMKN